MTQDERRLVGAAMAARARQWRTRIGLGAVIAVVFFTMTGATFALAWFALYTCCRSSRRRFSGRGPWFDDRPNRGEPVPRDRRPAVTALTRALSSPFVPFMPYRKTVLIVWQTVRSRRACFVRPGSRSRPWIWFRDGDVPEFEGPAARVVVEKCAGRWVAMERLEAPDAATR